MRSLILSAFLGATALAGVAAANTCNASADGALNPRPDLGRHAAPYHVPDYLLDTPFADPHNLLYFAAPSHVLRREQGPAAPARETVIGQVKSVSAGGEFVLGDEHGQDWTFSLSPNAITPRGGVGTAAGLGAGDHVAVTYAVRGGRLVATAIRFSDRLADLSGPAGTR